MLKCALVIVRSPLREVTKYAPNSSAIPPMIKKNHANDRFDRGEAAPRGRGRISISAILSFFLRKQEKQFMTNGTVQVKESTSIDQQ